MKGTPRHQQLLRTVVFFPSKDSKMLFPKGSSSAWLHCSWSQNTYVHLQLVSIIPKGIPREIRSIGKSAKIIYFQGIKNGSKAKWRSLQRSGSYKVNFTIRSEYLKCKGNGNRRRSQLTVPWQEQESHTQRDEKAKK